MRFMLVAITLLSNVIVHAMGPDPKPPAEKDPIWSAEKEGYARVAHEHDASALNSGTIDDARLAPEVSRLGQKIEGNEVEPGALLLNHLGASGAQSNDVPRWNGTSWVPASITSSPSDMYCSVPPAALRLMAEPLTPGHSFQVNSERLCLFSGSPAGNIAFLAPLYLPDGATIQDVTYSYIDNDPNRRIQFYIQGTVQGGGMGAGWVDAVHGTEGDSVKPVRKMQPFTTPRVIDNRNRSYVLSVVIDSGATTNLQFLGASVRYTLP